jgi:hypothetical protein
MTVEMDLLHPRVGRRHKIPARMNGSMEELRELPSLITCERPGVIQMDSGRRPT